MGFSFEFKRRKGGLFLLLYKYPFSSSEKVVRDFSSKNSEKSRTWVGFLVAENFRFLKTLSLKKNKSFWGFTVWFQKNGGDRIFFLRRETFCFINSVSIAVFRRNVVAVSVCPFVEEVLALLDRLQFAAPKKVHFPVLYQFSL